ncbi:hypothetical protein RB195_013139 [Necator americanus]|uniref:Uncharacterized protein n=1 Tax=Necator americanus TaxID=51031 RepID=A0ABR1DU59_NECAM
MHRSSAQSPKEDVCAQWMGLGCPIHAQRNEHFRMHQHRGCSEEDQEHQDPYLPLQHSTPTQLQLNFNTPTQLFSILPALTYASETWTFRKQEENAVSVIERAIERVVPGVPRFTQVRGGIRSSLLRQRSKIRDAAAFAKKSKIKWAGHVMRFNGKISSRSPSKKIMMLFVSHAKGGTTGLLWHAIGTNGRTTGATRPVRRSVGVKKNPKKYGCIKGITPRI